MTMADEAPARDTAWLVPEDARLNDETYAHRVTEPVIEGRRMRITQRCDPDEGMMYHLEMHPEGMNARGLRALAALLENIATTDGDDDNDAPAKSG